MANEHIIISQSILKELEGNIYSLYKIISEIDIIVFDIQQNWGALSMMRKHFAQDIGLEED